MTDLSALHGILQAQDWPRAERLLRRAAQKKGAPAEVYYNLAKVLEARGKPAQRQIWLKRAVSERPDYAMAWFELGRAALDDGDLVAAAQAFDTAARLAPEDHEARRLSAQLALRLGDWEKAKAGFAESTDSEARLARYRIAAEQGEDTTAARAALLRDPEMRPAVLRVLTRTAKGTLPLKLPQFERT
ncbi:tetratricopeptide repeat protein [uncultured Roseobacter sp.]|uniref:tetratricopeptide repeat protein n=1 Tax=uncultured Roseobacter sp. TaxID=114847 RepID=UPI00263048C3|nr:tetratricopeptide repeat protein [uncultured Roseobacter sp.]